MDKRLKTILFVTLYILGIISCLTDCTIYYSIGVFFFILFLLYKKLISDRFAIVCLLVFFAGFLNSSLRIKDSDSISQISPVNDVTISGKVVSLPTSSSKEYTKFYMKVNKYKLFNEEEKSVDGKIIVTLFNSSDAYKNIEIGDYITTKGNLSLPNRASNPSEFCYASYLKHQNVFSRLFVNDGNYNITAKSKRDLYGFLANLTRIRNKIIDKHAKYIKSPELELLGGIVFGDDAINPTPKMQDSFRKSGLTHIIAASGMNVSMIFGMWFFISQLLRLNYRLSLIIGMISIICYTCMTGFGPPVLRASVMLLLILLGKLIDRKSDSISLIFIVAFIMLFISPSMIVNIGFELSFIVTLGLMIFAPLLLKKIENKFLAAIISCISVPIIAQFFASPIQMFYFNTFSTYSVFANILVVPALTIVSFAGFISCIFAFPASSELIKFFDIILHPLLTIIVNISDFFSSLPYSTITTVSPKPISIILFYATLLFLFLLFTRKTKIKQIVFCTIIIILLFIISLFIKTNKDPYILFFNVENADSALIKTKSGKHILIDTGKAGYKNFSTHAERIMLKYFEDENISNLDFLILTHFDSDHAGGTLPIISKIKVDKLIIKDKMPNAPLAKNILDKASSMKMQTIVPKNKEVILDEKNFKLTCFYNTSKDDNESSIINLLETKQGSFLFTADTTSKVLEEFLNLFPKNTILIKVPHHGSENTLSDKILNKLSPKYAIISTGRNVYGHPAPQTLELLKKHNIKILRTDKNNAVKVVFHKNKILLYAYNGKKKKFERVHND